METYLKNLVDVETFALFVEDGLINARPHPDDASLRVYAYSKEVQFGGIWTPETRLARGLMLQFDETDSYATAQVVGRGIPKFFTVEQAGSDWSAMKLVDDDEGVTVDEKPVIPMDAPAHVANKVNGALGLCYITPNGDVALSTKGSFQSLEAEVGTRILNRKIDEFQMNSLKKLIRNGYTPLVEIITPERPHPVDYGDREDIIYLGLVSHETGLFEYPKDYDLLPQFGVESAETMSYTTLREAVEAPYVKNTEGMVVTIRDEDGKQHLFKVKPPEYLELRRLFYSVQPKNITECLLSMTAEELAEADSWKDMHLGRAETVLSEGHATLARKHKETMFAKVVTVQNKVAELHAEYEEITKHTDGSRKDIALAIKQHGSNSSLLFAVMKDKLDGNKSVYPVTMKALLKEEQ